jgi:hypothetical protein
MKIKEKENEKKKTHLMAGPNLTWSAHLLLLRGPLFYVPRTDVGGPLVSMAACIARAAECSVTSTGGSYRSVPSFLERPPPMSPRPAALAVMLGCAQQTCCGAHTPETIRATALPPSPLLVCGISKPPQEIQWKGEGNQSWRRREPGIAAALDFRVRA